MTAIGTLTLGLIITGSGFVLAFGGFLFSTTVI